MKIENSASVWFHYKAEYKIYCNKQRLRQAPLCIKKILRHKERTMCASFFVTEYVTFAVPPVHTPNKLQAKPIDQHRQVNRSAL
jgi:hypothetical protein